MEPAGLGVGIVGLAGLLSSSLDILDKVKTYQSFVADSDVLNAQFEAWQLLFERWDHSVGDTGLLSAETRTVVEDIRSLALKILDANNASQTGRRKGGLPNNATLGAVNQPRTRDGAAVSRRRQVAWALWGKGDRTGQVTQLADLVQRLHDLVPPDRGETETRRAMRSWVLGQHSPNERYEDSRRRRLPDTCGWVFTRPDFVRWSSRDSPPGTPEILWIHGRPGFGKTILCSRIVEHLSAIPDTPVAHFFFSSDHESRNEPYVVMRSWVSQLESHPASQPHVFTLVHQSWTATHDQVATRATVTQLLREALRARPRCYLVVDGLDECTAPVDSSSSVARFLEDVKDATTSATRILVISREEPEIRQALRTGDPGRVTDR
ncbi:hypothetical protein ACHAO3_008397 [Verticillium nonalfalfae]